MSAWKFHGHCFDGDRLEIDGVNVWTLSWRPTGTQAGITDPLYGTKYQFPIYEAGDPPHVIRFAASELSNTVWGFFVEQPARQPRTANREHTMCIPDSAPCENALPKQRSSR